MKSLAKFLRLDFVPRSSDCALLLLRLWIGLSMLLLHGWGKLAGFSEKSDKFMSVFGLGPKASMVLAIFGEFVCSILLVLGLFTRFAAVAGAITMFVAFTVAHKGVLKGAASGELAFIYLAAYLAIFLAGGGRFSLDAKTGGKK